MTYIITFTKTRNGKNKYQISMEAETRLQVIDDFYSIYPKYFITGKIQEVTTNA